MKSLFLWGTESKLQLKLLEHRLILDTRHHLDLFQTLCVPSVSRNLFGNGCFRLFKHNHFISSGILCDGLYKLKLDNFFAETFLNLIRRSQRQRKSNIPNDYMVYLKGVLEKILIIV
ncbi:hypothetical protein ACOSQ2_032409 [Xanthoceras sorbifolium]